MSERHLMRSVLLVPPRPDDLAAAMVSGASAVVADLTLDAGSLEQRRNCVAAWLKRQRAAEDRPSLYVGVHDIENRAIEADLDALFPGAPDGLLLPRARSAEDVQRLAVKLAVREAEHGLVDGGVGILAGVAATARGVLALNTFAEASSRLRGLASAGQALAADLGWPSYDPADEEPAALTHARALTLLVAKAAGIPAFEATAAANGQTAAGLCARARRDGFAGVLTTNTEQVRLIEAAYAGSADVPGISRP